MAKAPKPGVTGEEAAAITASKLGIETVLAVCGALVAAGFFLPWLGETSHGSLSGLDVALGGGLWTGVFAIPALGLATAVSGVLRWRASRYAGALTALALLAPATYLVAAHWPWIYSFPVAAGVVIIVLGTWGRAPWLNLPLGAVLLVLSVVGPLFASDRLLPEFDAGVLSAIVLVGLETLIWLCGAWLLWSGLRKNGRERPLVVTGSSIIALGAYLAALDAFGPALAGASIGLWMCTVGGSVLLVASRPLATRAKGKRARPAGSSDAAKKAPDKVPAEAKAKADAEKDAKAEAKTDAKAEQAAPVAASESASKSKAGPAAKPKDQPVDAAEAARRAKLEKLKKLKLLKLLKAKRLADAKAAKEEAATAKAGEALASEAEPAFAADPTAPPPPDDEDREALMQRMGVKAPPPPSEDELEAMLAKLKQSTDDT